MKTEWLCLEFTKTVGWESRDTPDDRLQRYDDLVSWALEHGCIDELGARELLNEAAARPERSVAVEPANAGSSSQSARAKDQMNSEEPMTSSDSSNVV